MFQLLPKIHPLFPMFSALSLPCLPPLFLREDNIAQGAIKINLLVDKLLIFVNNSSVDLILSLRDTVNSYVSLEKYYLPKNHQHNTLQAQGAKCTLLLETKNGEKYSYQFQAKEEKCQLHTVMYVIIMPDLSLYLVDSISELQNSPNNSQRLLPINFLQ